MMHYVLGVLRIDVNSTPDGVVSDSSVPDLDGVVGETERIDNGKQILQDIIARMTVMYRLIIARNVRLLTGGEEVRDEVEAMVQECLREAGVEIA